MQYVTACAENTFQYVHTWWCSTAGCPRSQYHAPCTNCDLRIRDKTGETSSVRTSYTVETGQNDYEVTLVDGWTTPLKIFTITRWSICQVPKSLDVKLTDNSSLCLSTNISQPSQTLGKIKNIFDPSLQLNMVCSIRDRDARYKQPWYNKPGNQRMQGQ